MRLFYSSKRSNDGNNQASHQENHLLPLFDPVQGDFYKYFDQQANSLRPPQSSPYHTEPSRWQKFLNIFKRTASKLSPIKQTLKVAVVGIHGWYPAARIVQTVFGEPEGTSEKFSAMMCEAVGKSSFASEHDLVIQQIVLTGHGRVESRVKSYLEMIKSEHLLTLKEADLIIFVTHSQGTPVSTILISKLLRQGIVDSQRQSIGLLCMAGISHGPYPTLRDNLVIQYVETEAARELFDFCEGGLEDERDQSELTKMFWTSLWFILECNVHITCVGSWRDQVVPLYSALLTSFHHPNILRAVYIDSFNYRDDFLTRLVVFLIKLRNYGISDHNLLVYLSPTLTGSLYNGSAHSTIYDEEKVYSLAFEWLLFQRSLQLKIPGKITRFFPFKVSLKQNPYFIPWAFQRLIQDPIIRSDEKLYEELNGLLEEYKDWSPYSKSGRDLKYRLEPISIYVKSRL